MSKKPRILIFSLAYEPFWGGAELAVKEITDRLDEDFDMVTYRFDKKLAPQEKIGNVEVFRVGMSIETKNEAHYGHKIKKLFWGWLAFFKALRLHRKHPYQMTWCLMAGYSAVPAFLFKIIHPHTPLLLTLQEGDEEGHIKKRVGLFLPLWKLFFRMVDYIQVISAYLSDWAKRNGAKCPIEVVPNGVDIQEFQARNSEFRKKLQQDLGTKEGEKVIITTSRLVPKNAVDMLIEAVYILKSMSPHLKFKVLIVGDGPKRDPLELQVSKSELENYIIFTGAVPYEHIPDYLGMSDIFVRASRSEGLGTSFLEAMAMGVPIIATPVGGIPDFLTDEKTGLFVEVDDAHDIARKIKKLLENDELRRRLIENGKKIVIEQYDWGVISKRLQKIFNSLVM